MRKAMMMLAFVGSLTLTNAQNESTAICKQAVTLFTQMNTDKNANAAILFKKLNNKTLNHSSNNAPVKKLIDTYEKTRVNDYLKNYIYSNPEFKNHMVQNRRMMYNMGFSIEQIDFVQAYLKSSVK